jgi:signal transduction histidine kinase/AraC-like DNA-binding protein/AmiR/NasT family two-component response regulator
LTVRRKKIHTYLNDPEDPNSINSEQINYIFESEDDNSNVLWIGTSGGGLNRFERKTEIFSHFTVDDGLPDNVIYGILEDDHRNLWLSTDNGLSRFNPDTKLFRNFDVNDGLLGNQFNPGACSKNINGEMLFGSTKGLIAFHPDSLIDNPHIPNIVITDFQLFNKPVKIEKKNTAENDENYKLPAAVSQLKKIKLTYQENIFSFEFAALDYRSPNKNQYVYMLEGLESDWNYTDYTRRYATYTNLDPGEYTFRVKGSNNDGIWNEKGTSIQIIISPPWWKTNLVYAFYLLVVGSIVFATWRAQLRRIRLKQQLKMEHFESEKLREVDQLKSRFFTNISHEFRTPLTLIIGSVKQMLAGDFIGNFKEQYRMIIRNGERLLKLINEILDLSKLESGQMKLQVVETDIVQFLKGIVLNFSPLADRKKVTLKFKSTEDELIGYVDHDKLEKIVTNLLSNAFKFTPEEGKIIVSISPLVPPLLRGDAEGRGVEIKISNTGPGIPADRIDKIFDRFYQSDDNYKKDGEGTGVGLALAKELVELCRWEISVSSIPDKRTTFIITLPVAKECFKADEIMEKTESAGRKPETGIESGSDIQFPDSVLPSPVSVKSSPVLLIVEDNPDVTAYISSFMKHDYLIVTAENGEEGLKKSLDTYPDLIISDVMMPEMDGFEFCQKVKSDECISHIPVILLTAKADLDSKIKGLEFGADDYISKPFEADELKVRSKNLIEQRIKLREKFSRMIEIKPGEIAASSMDEQFLQRLLDIFENHISDPDYNTESFAREIGMSRSNLYRKIQALTNQSTHNFFQSLRLKRAAQLLRKRSATISEIAYAVGFNSPSYFSKVFRKHFDQSPSDFVNHSK